MVFGALLEYATVSYAGKRIKLNIFRWAEFNRKVLDLKAEMERQSNADYQLKVLCFPTVGKELGFILTSASAVDVQCS